MDFSKFKRISSDDNVTKLMHPAGHEISIAHKALNPKMRDQLLKLPVAMADGGTVEKKTEQPVINVNLGGALQPNLQASAADFAAMPNAQPQANPYQQQLSGLQNEFPGLAQSVGPEAPIFKNAAVQRADQAVTQEEKQNLRNSQNAEEARGSIIEEAQKKLKVGAPLTADEQAALSAPKAQDPRMQAYEAALAEINKPVEKQVSPQGSALQSGLNQYESGIRQEASAQGKLAEQQAQIMQQEQEQYQKRQQISEQKFNELMSDSETLKNDILSGKIDANRYLNQMSGGQRVMTAIGLFLGGLGGGLTGKGGNIAMDYLNNAIDRDIKSQETELGKKQNLLSRNLQEMGSLKEAMELTRVQYKDMLATKLEMEAAKMKNPILQAQVTQQVGKMRIENADKMQSIASGFAANSPLGMINRLPKEMQGPALKELGEVAAIDSGMKEVSRIIGEMSKVGAVERYSPFSGNRIETLKAGLVKQAKNVLGEAMQEADVKRLVDPFVPGLLTSGSSQKKAELEFLNMLKAQKSAKSPILSRTGIVSDESKYNFTPRK